MTARSTRDRKAARGGRPSKGKRHSFMSRVPEELADLVMDSAERSGLTYSDYIALVLAEKHDYTLPDHIKPRATDNSLQEAFEMQTAS